MDVSTTLENHGLQPIWLDILGDEAEHLQRCLEILEEQYDPDELTTRIQRLLTKMGLRKRYGERWEQMYAIKHISQRPRDLIFLVTLPRFIYTHFHRYGNAIQIFYDIRQLDDGINIMQGIVNICTTSEIWDHFGRIFFRYSDNIIRALQQMNPQHVMQLVAQSDSNNIHQGLR